MTSLFTRQLSDELTEFSYHAEVMMRTESQQQQQHIYNHNDNDNPTTGGRAALPGPVEQRRPHDPLRRILAQAARA